MIYYMSEINGDFGGKLQNFPPHVFNALAKGILIGFVTAVGLKN